MKTLEPGVTVSEPRTRDGIAGTREVGRTAAEANYERWAHLHINWSALWIGALVTCSVLLLFGLAGLALGAHVIAPEQRVIDLRKIGIATLIFSVCAAFFSAVAGGWCASKIAGILHSEPAMLHGAFVWLLTIPMLLVGSALRASSLVGGWYAGLGAHANKAEAPFVRPDAPSAAATPTEIASYKLEQAEYNRNVKQWIEETPKATRNSALGAITALMLGLLGSVIGGWMACGEPMNFTHYRTREP